MRLKLVTGVSMLAAVLGTGSCIAIVLTVFSSLKPISKPGALVGATLLLPVTAIVAASIFVYRHTARRRKLQALLTALLTTFLTITLFVVAAIVSARSERLKPPQPLAPHIAS